MSLTGSFCLPAQALEATALRCEYRVNPDGLDVREPRLSWELKAERRGQRQTACQILVASSREELEQDRGDLWNSGKIDSDQSIQVVYRGRLLVSRAQAFWKVRVWDEDGQPSGWSPAASWTMGLLERSDWQARWIAVAEQVRGAELRPSRGPHNGYHSAIAPSPEATKWAAVDLGQAQTIDAVRLYPARPFDWQPDTPGFLFPVRFRVEVAQQADFSDAQTVVDRTSEDQPNPGTNAPLYRFTPVKARYVKLVTTRLRLRSKEDYGMALAEMEVLREGKNLARGVKVTALDSIETGAWSKSNLVDGRLVAERPVPASESRAAVMFRKSFHVPVAVRRATAYATGLGLYQLQINGRRVGDHLLAPEWTNYRKHIQYQSYDVTPLLQAGENAVGALVGEGWYLGRLMGIPGDAYGTYPRFLMQLEIELVDGRSQTVVTEDSWRATEEGPIRAAGIYAGETYDAGREMAGWDRSSFDDRSWKPVRSFELGTAQLVWQRNEPIRVEMELKPVALTEPKPQVYVFDLGQNMVGWCRLELKGPRGTTVTIRHAEVLNEDGTLYTANLRGAPQVDRYTLRGDGEEVFEPHFTYHGFRYVEVTGALQRPALTDLVGCVFHSAAPIVGQVESSNPQLNRLMQNILWTQRANLMSSPNDCPQRDERFGWMGDIQAFSQTAIFNMDMAAFFSKWVRDIRDDQADDGRFPDFAPHPGDPNSASSGAPAWADAGVIVPWRAYQNYGDTRLLDEHFDAARRWVDYVHRLNPNLLWLKGRNADYNDWLNGDWVRQQGWPAKGGSVPNPIFATAFFAHSADLVARMAERTGRLAEAKSYRDLFEQIKAAFVKSFVQVDSRIEGDTQGGYALALNFNLLPNDARDKAAQHLVDGIERYHGHLSTGIQTTHRAMLELTQFGHNDVACRLLLNQTFPSWFYMIENDATTIWERWDGYVKGRGFQDPGMNSLNHWAFGAVGEWVWRNIVGINPDESRPGYQHFVIEPRPCGDLTWAKGSYHSIRGLIRSEWRLEAGSLKLDVQIPPNTTATVFIPTQAGAGIKESGQPAAQAEGVRLRGTEEGAAIFEVQSGTYSFSAASP